VPYYRGKSDWSLLPITQHARQPANSPQQSIAASAFSLSFLPPLLPRTHSAVLSCLPAATKHGRFIVERNVGVSELQHSAPAEFGY
jgi:hypothetical protein